MGNDGERAAGNAERANFGSYTDHLRRAIADQKAAFVIGAGVSKAATGSDIALWPGLLENGVRRCYRNDPELGESFVERQRSLISATMNEVLAVGDIVEGTLRDQSDYGNWLEETVGSLRCSASPLLDALARFKLPLATTNYDMLLELATQRQGGITTGDAGALGVLRGDRDAILHLHGYWEKPDSIVLGARSYRALIENAALVAKQQMIAQITTLIFVGFGKGLHDPNFKPLVRWLADALKNTPYYHYQLVLDGDVKAERAALPSNSRIRVIGYGETFEALPGFLATFVPRAKQPPPLRSEPDATRKVIVPPPEALSEKGVYFNQFVGREAMLGDFNDAVESLMARARGQTQNLRTLTRVMWIHGFGGMGKSTFLRRACIEARRQNAGALEVALVDWEPGRWLSPLNAPPTSPAQMFEPIAQRVAQWYGPQVLEPYWRAYDDVRFHHQEHVELRDRFRDALTALEQLGPDWRSAVLPADVAAQVQGVLRNDTARRDRAQLEQTLRQLGEEVVRFDDAASLRSYIGGVKQNQVGYTALTESWALSTLGHHASPAALVSPVRVLADALRASLEAACRVRPLILALDTCNHLPPDCDRSLRSLISNVIVSDVPFMVVIGSRRTPESLRPLGVPDTWSSQIQGRYLRVEEFDDKRLFTMDEIARVLAVQRIPITRSPELVDLLYRVTKGVPLAIRLLLDTHESSESLLAELAQLDDRIAERSSLPEAVRKVIDAVAGRFLDYLENKQELADDFAAIIAVAIQRVPNLELLGRLWGTDELPEERLRHLSHRYAIFRGGELHQTVRTFVRMQWRAERPAILPRIARRLRELYGDMRPSEHDIEAHIDWLIEDLNLALWEDPTAGVGLFPARVAVVLAQGSHREALRELLDDALKIPRITKRRFAPLSRLIDASTATGPESTWREALDIEWLDNEVNDRCSELERASAHLIAGLSLFDPRERAPRSYARTRERLGLAIRYFGRRLPRANQVVRAYAYSVLMTSKEPYEDKDAAAVELIREAGLSAELDKYIRTLSLYSRDIDRGAAFWLTLMGSTPSASEYHTLAHIYSDPPEDVRYDLAQGAFERAMELEPQLARHEACMAALAYRRGNVKAAHDIAERAIAKTHESDDPEGLNNLAWMMYEQRGDLVAAERYARTAYESSSTDIHVLHTLVAIEMLRDNWRDGRRDLQHMLESENWTAPALRRESIYQVVADALRTHGAETVALLRSIANAADWTELAEASDVIVRRSAASHSVDARVRKHVEALQRFMPSHVPRKTTATRKQQQPTGKSRSRAADRTKRKR